jgi:hypothetical protein
MKQLFENAPSENLFHKSVLKGVNQRTFDIESIELVKTLSGSRCDVVAKDSKGHRSFRVMLEKNANYPHYYKIFNIKEQRLVSNYQWKEVR